MQPPLPHNHARYDAEGRRVRKITGGAAVDYLFDLAGRQISVFSAGSYSRGEVYAGGRHLVTYANGGTTFSHIDGLGTERVRSTALGVSCETITSLPFGDGQGNSGSCNDASPLHFTGKERDSESGLDDFDARYYASNLGRFMSPDWSAAPMGVPYADFGNPQSLNLYSYVKNNPLSTTDPDGHCPDGVDCSGNYSANQPPTFSQVGQFLVGVGKELVNIVTSTANNLLLSEGGGAVPSGLEIPQMQGSNFIQEAGMGATQGTVLVVGAVETGTTAVDAVAGRLAEAAVPDANVVVRGGAGEMPPQGTTFSGAHGATVEDAAQGVPHGQIRTSTAGDIRDAGGSVRSAPEPTRSGNINQKHVNVREGNNKPSTFSQPKPNPVPKKDRVQ